MGSLQLLPSATQLSKRSLHRSHNRIGVRVVVFVLGIACCVGNARFRLSVRVQEEDTRDVATINLVLFVVMWCFAGFLIN